MELFRHKNASLKRWFENRTLRQNPCVLFGPRQVGKTTLAINFAKTTGREVILVNFWKDPEYKFKEIFSKSSFAPKILQDLELFLGQRIDQDKSILVLDEIQECPHSYSSLKSFKEDAKIPVIATGSYLKLYLAVFASDGLINPIGCTHEIAISPLTFSEYLLNRSEFLYEKYLALNVHEAVQEVLHEKLIEIYREYLFLGGMPEPMVLFLEALPGSPLEAQNLARAKQKDILLGIQNDFLLFSQKNRISANQLTKLGYLFDRIATELQTCYTLDTPLQRFKFSSLGKYTTFRRVADAFNFLLNAGLVLPSKVVRTPQFPIAAGIGEKHSFKIFYYDIGILNAKLGLNFNSITRDKLSMYKGVIAENFVAQQLSYLFNGELLSWKSKHHEIEFLINKEGNLLPVEVKSSTRSLKAPSLCHYIKKYSPEYAYKLAPRNYGDSGEFRSYPIYLTEKIFS